MTRAIIRNVSAVLAAGAILTASLLSSGAETVRSSKSGCTITHNDNGTLTIVCPKGTAK